MLEEKEFPYAILMRYRVSDQGEVYKSGVAYYKQRITYRDGAVRSAEELAAKDFAQLEGDDLAFVKGELGADITSALAAHASEVQAHAQTRAILEQVDAKLLEFLPKHESIMAERDAALAKNAEFVTRLKQQQGVLEETNQALSAAEIVARDAQAARDLHESVAAELRAEIERRDAARAAQAAVEPQDPFHS